MKDDDRQTVSIRPGRDVSTSSVIALAGMVVFGIVFTGVVAGVLYDNEAPWGLSLLFGVFMLGWLATALSLLIYHVRNLRRARGVALFEVDLGGTSRPDDERPTGRPDARP